MAQLRPSRRTPSLPTELMWNLTLRELRGRFKRSALGWTWSVLNPLVFIGIYSFVFSIAFRASPPVGENSGLDSYAFFLVAALLPWTFFSNAVTGSIDSITGNESLIKKVYFPRTVLPASAVLAWSISFAIEYLVLATVLVVTGTMVIPWLVPAVAITVLLGLFALGIGMLLAPLNAYFRDVQYLTGLGLQVWFWATPIIWPISLLTEREEPVTLLGVDVVTLIQLNPMYEFVEAYRDVFYDLALPTAGRWLAMVVSAAVALLLGGTVFRRLEANLAEEL